MICCAWGATIDEGWRSATDVVERFGSAARGDRIYRAGHALGQLLRTVYLCDYFTLPDFRRPLYRVLERGESGPVSDERVGLRRLVDTARVRMDSPDFFLQFGESERSVLGICQCKAIWNAVLDQTYRVVKLKAQYRCIWFR